MCVCYIKKYKYIYRYIYKIKTKDEKYEEKSAKNKEESKKKDITRIEELKQTSERGWGRNDVRVRKTVLVKNKRTAENVRRNNQSMVEFLLFLKEKK